MKDWIKPLTSGIIGGLLGGMLCLIILAIAYNNSEVFGNVADWVSGVGSVTAIYFVYRQIKQQTDQHSEEKGHYFEIAIGGRMMRHSDEKNAIVTSSGEQEIFFFGTNSGMMPSAFKYIGICNSEDYSILKENHDKSLIDHKNYTDPQIQSFDFSYDLGIKQRKFERVLPGDVSEEIVVSMEKLQHHFKGKCDNLYLVYMDVLGAIYGRNFGVPELNENVILSSAKET